MRKFIPLLTVFLAACGKQAPPPEPLRPVKTMEIAPSTTEYENSAFPGEVRSRHEIQLAFQVGGKISQCSAELGQKVHKGEVLATIEPADYRLQEQAEQAQTEEANAALILARDDLARYVSLSEKGFVSKAALEQKQAAFTAARARMDTVQSSRSLASRRLDYTRLLSPAEAVVTSRECNVGQVVGAGESLLQVAIEMDKEIAIHVPENKAAALGSDKKFSIILNAAPGKAYEGVLRELSAAADPATRTYSARISVKNPDAAMMLGMSAQVQIESSQKPVIRLPLLAITSGDGKPSVWIVDAHSTVHRQPIEVGGSDGNTVIITHGLKTGDKVVTAGANLLRDNEQVRAENP